MTAVEETPGLDPAVILEHEVVVGPLGEEEAAGDEVSVVDDRETDLDLILDRLDSLSSELDAEPIRRLIVELMRAVDHQPLVERIDGLARVLTGPAGTRPIRALGAEIEQIKTAINRDVVDRIDGMVTALDTASIVKAIQRAQWPVLDRIEELATSRVDADTAGLTTLNAAFADLRATLQDQVLDRLAPLSDGVDPDAIAEAIRRSEVTDRLESLLRSLEKVDLSVGTDMSRITVELVAIRDQLAALAVPADLASLLEAVRQVDESGAGARVAGVVEQMADSLYPKLLLDRLQELKNASDPTPVLHELRSLRASLDPAAVLDKLDRIPGRVAEGPLSACLEELAHAADQTALRRRLDEVHALAAAADPGPVLDGISALGAALAEVDLEPLAKRLDSLAAGSDLAAVLQAIRVVRASLSELQFDHSETATVLNSAMARLDELKRLADPGFLIHELGDIQAKLGGRPLADRFEKLERADRSQQVLQELAELKSLLGDRPLAEVIDLRTQNLDHTPVLERLEVLRRELEAVSGQQLADGFEALAAADRSSQVLQELADLKSVLGEQPLAEVIELRTRTLDQTPVLERLEELRRAADLAEVVEKLDGLAARMDAADVSADVSELSTSSQQLGESVSAALSAYNDKLELAQQQARADLDDHLRRYLNRLAVLESGTERLLTDGFGELRAADRSEELLQEVAEVKALLGDRPVAEVIDLRTQLLDHTPVLDRLEELSRAVDLAPVLEKLDGLATRAGAEDIADGLDDLIDSSEQLQSIVSSTFAAFTGALEQAQQKTRQDLGEHFRGYLNRLAALEEAGEKQLTSLERVTKTSEALARRLGQIDLIEARMDKLQSVLDGLPAEMGDWMKRALDARDQKAAEAARAQRNEDLEAKEAAAQWAAKEAEVRRAAEAKTTGELATLASRLQSLESRLDDAVSGLNDIRFAQIDRDRLDDAARQQSAVQMAEISERLVALRRRIALRAR